MRVRTWFTEREIRELEDQMGQLPWWTNASSEGDRVVIGGTVQPPERPLVAPQSQLPCVYYASLAGTFAEQAATRFPLVGRRGEAIVVDPTHVIVAVRPLRQRALETEQAYRLRLAHRNADGWATGEETIVAVGQRVRIAGLLVRELFGTSAYRDPETQLVLAGTDDAPLVIVDA